MIDIHTHLLPGIDDGPETWEEALLLLKEGAEDGIREAVCTSHVLDRLDQEVERQFGKAFRELEERAAVAGIPVRLWLGSELHCRARFEYRAPLSTFNANGKYLLFEIPMNDFPKEVGQLLFGLTMEGITPIMAHPERNSIVRSHPEILNVLIERGILMQANSGSITGMFGKDVRRAVLTMLEHRLIHFVASDCHSSGSRPMKLQEARTYVAREWGQETAEALFHLNPGLSVRGGEIHTPVPVPFKKKSRYDAFTLFESR